MTALLAPASPRLAAVRLQKNWNSASGTSKKVRSRAHLRLVTEDFSAGATSVDASARLVAQTQPVPVVRQAEPAKNADANLQRRRVAAPSAAASVLPPVARRLALAVLVFCAGLAVVAAGIIFSGFIATPVAGAATTVQSGQSLWDIAANTGSADVAETVAQIIDLNDLESSTVQAGQVLLLPAQ